MKITYAVATSRDGFIAREDGDVSWLEEVGDKTEDTNLAEFFACVDGLIMGRHTYDFVWNYGTWPYQDKPTWVCTHRELEPLEGANLLVVDSIDDVIAGASRNRFQHLWLIGGADLASSFLDAGLVTHLSITELPIDLGNGIPLFARHDLQEIPVAKKETVEKNGFRQIEMTISSRS